MRVHINLATRPYEDVGQFYRTWGALLALVVLITAALVGLVLSSYMGARTVGKQTAELQRQMNAYDQQKRTAEEMLNRPENRDVRDRSRFLNALIARKAFSWTQVFSDLEKIIPARVHVISIKPDLSPDNQIEVALKVETDSREKSVDLIRRMEESKTFRQAQVKSESAQGGSGGARMVQFEILAVYVPHVQQPQHETGAQGGAQ